MTEIDTDKLRSFIERYDSGDVMMRPDDRFRTERYLWNNRAAILAMAEENKRLRQALDRIKRIAAGYEPDGSDYDEGYFEGQRNMANIARRALGKDKA